MSSLFNNFKKNNSENVFTPQSRCFKRRFCAQTRRSLKSLICLKYKSKRRFPQYCILSSSTLHSRSLPLKVMEKDQGENLDIWKAKIEKRAKGNLYIKVMEKRARGEF